MRMIGKKEILIPLKEHWAYFYKGTIICSQEYVSKYQKSWGSKGDNADPHDYTTWSNKSKGENADLYADIMNLSHNVSEEIDEKIRFCQNSLRENSSTL